MKTQVWTQGCNSWYKNSEGRITTNWPGTFLHFADTISNPRWEDYDWQKGLAPLKVSDAEAKGSLKALLADGRGANEPAVGVMGPSPAPYLDGKLASMYDIKPVARPTAATAAA
ncbi:hypothetical protein CBOM_03501 [Ceraceosorus bombacis]|uniref:Uncharacterized protein n=1 Tax=Ceraceosorus bombacis TaxID=401625 RepID=A0A0P1BG69_9BASI|nr:hypothetical protein CBOM_03501 [Ceraceosorus bombacis]